MNAQNDFSKLIPPGDIIKTAGTWTPSVASNVIKDTRTAADAAFTLIVPLDLVAADAYRSGAKLKSVDLVYKIATAACDDFATVEIEKVAIPATGAAPSGAALTVTLDAGHDTAAERLAEGDHTMTVTLATPVYLTDDYGYYLVCVVDAAATTVFTLFGARVNFTFRD